MIVCNDVMAYLFGFFFGRTPLIKLSPKKTWEGFIGGGIATVIFGVVFSYFLCQFQFFICPIEYNEAAGRMGMVCEPSYLFRPQQYTLSLVSPSKLIEWTNSKPFCSHFSWRSTKPLQCIHSCCTHCRWVFSAQSLDRSVDSLRLDSNVLSKSKWVSIRSKFAMESKLTSKKIRLQDFGDMIPGHGGIMDRFDCQFLMATFVNVYISSFIRTASPAKLLQQVIIPHPNSLQKHFFVSSGWIEPFHTMIFNSAGF